MKSNQAIQMNMELVRYSNKLLENSICQFFKGNQDIDMGCYRFDIWDYHLDESIFRGYIYIKDNKLIDIDVYNDSFMSSSYRDIKVIHFIHKELMNMSRSIVPDYTI